MTSGVSKARATVARGWAFFAAVLVLALVGGAVTAAAADTRTQASGVQAVALYPFGTDPEPISTNPQSGLQVSVERWEETEPADNPNAVSAKVTVREADGKVPEVDYAVFSQVFQSRPPDGQEPKVSDPAACTQPKYTSDPTADKGIFQCAYVVESPDVWTFTVTVTKGEGGKVAQLAKAQGTFPVNDAVALSGQSKGLRYVVEGSTFEVFILQAHFASASVWLLTVLVMAFLAVPRLRKMCSTLTLHTLEVRRGFITSLMWAMFAAILITGVYLLRQQTAYAAPWSWSAWENVTKLPYATQYFTTLYLKIIIFVVMAAASVVLMMEAARQARLAGDAGPGFDADDDEFWGRLQLQSADDPGEGTGNRGSSGGGAGGATAVASQEARSKIVAQGVSPRTLWLCVFAVAGGMGAIGVCVTVLKYTHELIEMLVAYKTVVDAK
jgi:hypothetical protein